MSHLNRVPYYAGWDVGGWNCDKNPRSRDAIAILDEQLNIVGQPWRGNLRQGINKTNTSAEWTALLFGLCEVEAPTKPVSMTLAIDTPLGFPDAFKTLLESTPLSSPIESSVENPYLYRHTERWLATKGFTPLSSIKDMIGSQATKGIHVVRKFCQHNSDCGVWTDSEQLTCIEAYPSPCRDSQSIQELQKAYPIQRHDDLTDAITCALVAHAFLNNRDSMVQPDQTVSKSEGWIWLPRDVFAGCE